MATSLDFTSHIAATPLGYNNPTLEANMEAFDLPSPTKIAGQNFFLTSGWPPAPTTLSDYV